MLTIQVQGLDTLQAGLRAAPTLLDKRVQDTMEKSLLLIEQDARRHVKQDTRRLMNSITHRISRAATALTGRVGPSERYGFFVERGTRPHWPPRAPLEGWARRHGIPVFLVQRSIARRGTKAQPFLLPAYERQRQGIISRFQAIGAQVVETIARGGR